MKVSCNDSAGKYLWCSVLPLGPFPFHFLVALLSSASQWGMPFLWESMLLIKGDIWLLDVSRNSYFIGCLSFYGNHCLVCFQACLQASFGFYSNA